MKNYTSLFRYAILFCVLFFSAAKGQAQTADYNIGIDGYNFVGVAVRPLADGSSIIAGYEYSIWPVIYDATMLLLHVKNNTVLWAQKWGNNSGNSLIQDMIIAANGDIIVVSSETGTGVIRMPGIYRFAANGNLLYQNRLMAEESPYPNLVYANAIFQGVCELPDGRIVAVGTYTYQGKQQGIVVTYTASLTFIYHDILYMGSPVAHQHTFTGVVPDLSNALGDSVLICGGDWDGAVFKSLLTSYKPPVSRTSVGVFNWVNLYNIQDSQKINSRFTQIYYAYQDPINHSNDRLILSGRLSSDSGAVNNSEQFSFSCDRSGTANVRVFGFNNGMKFTNTSKIYPSVYDNLSDDFEVYISENPASVANDPVLNADKAIMNGRISDIASLDDSFLNYSRSNAVSQYSMLDIRQYPFSMVPLTYTVGTMAHSGGVNWIYYTVSNPYYHKTTITHPDPLKIPECDHADQTLNIRSLQATRSTMQPYNGKLTVDLGQPELQAQPISLNIVSVCGTIDTTCGNMNVTLVRVPIQNGSDSCAYKLKGIVTPGYGWTSESFAWHIGATVIYHIDTSGSINEDSITVHIANSAATTVTVDVLLQDSFGHECNIVKQLQLSCNNPPCDSNIIKSISVATAIPQANSSCYVVVTTIAGPAYGWTVTGWTTISSLSGIQNFTSSNDTNYLYDNISNFGLDFVTITVHLVDSNGNTCDITKTITIQCNNGQASIYQPPCEANEITNVTASPAFPGGGNGCNLVISASVNVAYGWTVTGWTWQGAQGTQSTTASATTDSYWLGFMYNSTANLLTITVHLVDAAGDTCSITKVVTVVCNNGTGQVMKHSEGTHVTYNPAITNLQPEKASIKIYPNPTNGAINISSSEPDITTVEVFDISGKKLDSYQFDNANEAHISIGQYAEGTYLLKVNNNTMQLVNKLR